MKPTSARWARAGAAALLWFAAWPGFAAEKAEAIESGAHASFTDSTGRTWCVTVVTIATGPGGEPWAWFTVDAHPSRIEHTRVAELLPGCPAQ